MKKIIVIGSPGSGKSRFSLALSEKLGIPVFHLDLMFWNPDKTTVGREILIERQRAVFEREEWIIDGNYKSTMELRLEACDTVFFLDYPTEVCIEGVRERRGVPRVDMPWIEVEEDEEFIEFIKGYREKERPRVMALFEKYKEKSIYIFKSREEGNAFLNEQNA